MRNALLVAALLASSTACEERAPGGLPAPDGNARGEFQNIASVRELADGRVLFTDSREQSLFVADFRAGTTQTIGARGQGPNEFERVGQLLAGGGDTTIMLDVGRRRWLFLDGDRIVKMIFNTPETDMLARSVNGGATGNDITSWLAQGQLPPAPRPPYEIGPADSFPLVRYTRTPARVDTIVSLRRATLKRIPLPGFTDTDQQMTTQSTAWAHGETAAMCADSWIGVVRMQPYRVDWRSPSGQWTTGPAIRVKRQAVTQREKEAWLKRYRPPRPDMPDLKEPPILWPTEIPPATGLASVCAPDGRLFIPRSFTADRQFQMYDIVDRGGVVADRLALATNERMLGFGPRSIYIAWKDSVDIEGLRRHPYPW